MKRAVENQVRQCPAAGEVRTAQSGDFVKWYFRKGGAVYEYTGNGGAERRRIFK
ncbi:hypothetical protein SAMN05660368_00958 [Marvinbryantia formatexigens]|nr:hypothetical protein SAMN05660368_00958 [Marvinbryantia formatexigens]